MENENYEESILTVKSPDGTDYRIFVFDIVDDEASGKSYISYKFLDTDSEDCFISILNEKDDEYSLETIEDIDEFKAVENLLASRVIDED